MISIIDNNNFNMYKSFINACVEYSSAVNFYTPNSMYLDTIKDLELFTGSNEFYIAHKNNKMIGFFSLRFFEDNISILYYSNGEVCKLSVLSLISIAIETSIERAKEEVSNSLTVFLADRYMLRLFTKRFLKIHSNIVDNKFTSIFVSLKEGNLITS